MSASLGEHKHKEWREVVALQWMPLIEVHVFGLDIIKRLFDFLSLSCSYIVVWHIWRLSEKKQRHSQQQSSCHDLVWIFD